MSLNPRLRTSLKKKENEIQILTINLRLKENPIINKEKFQMLCFNLISQKKKGCLAHKSMENMF